jgi:hypothetical protein
MWGIGKKLNLTSGSVWYYSSWKSDRMPTYEVCPDDFRKIAKKNQLYLQHFVLLAFVNKAASDLHALQAALSLPPEHLGEVRRRAISRTPISVLIGGLLSKN